VKGKKAKRSKTNLFFFAPTSKRMQSGPGVLGFASNGKNY
jgi:hypothetical protein